MAQQPRCKTSTRGCAATPRIIKKAPEQGFRGHQRSRPSQGRWEGAASQNEDEEIECVRILRARQATLQLEARQLKIEAAKRAAERARARQGLNLLTRESLFHAGGRWQNRICVARVRAFGPHCCSDGLSWALRAANKLVWLLWLQGSAD